MSINHLVAAKVEGHSCMNVLVHECVEDTIGKPSGLSMWVLTFCQKLGCKIIGNLDVDMGGELICNHVFSLTRAWHCVRDQQPRAPTKSHNQ